MKDLHFKIVELDDYQVLVTKDFDNEDNDKPMSIITFFMDGLRLDLKMRYNTEEKRDIMFNEFSVKNARGIVDNIKKQFE